MGYDLISLFSDYIVVSWQCPVLSGECLSLSYNIRSGLSRFPCKKLNSNVKCSQVEPKPQSYRPPKLLAVICSLISFCHAELSARPSICDKLCCKHVTKNIRDSMLNVSPCRHTHEFAPSSPTMPTRRPQRSQS